MPAQDVKRARITALILALSAIVSIVLFVFARVQKSRADQLQTEVDSLKKQMEIIKSVGDTARLK